MEAEHKDGSDQAVANGKAGGLKRGRGRPKGSANKKFTSVKDVTHNARATRKVDFFSPETVLKPKVKKRGRPKKIRIPGRPRKIPLTPEEEAERILRLSKRKRKLSKPLGRPRIHPLVDTPKEKRGRGRPRKSEHALRASSQSGALNGSLKSANELGEGSPRKRGRPRGSFKKKRGPLASTPKRAIEGSSRRRGRPPGSGNKLKVKLETHGTPRKRGRPPGSKNKIKDIVQATDGTPRKRGRPKGSGNKLTVAKRESDGIPRKRGRPPGSGNKVKVAPREPNGVPRKRGRPPSSRKVKGDSKEAEDGGNSISSSALPASDQPRKRGRPSKASLAEALTSGKAVGGQNEVHDEPAAKRPCNPSENSERAEDVEDRKSSDNNPAKKEVPQLGVGRDAKPNSVERDVESDKQFEETSVEVLVTSHESNVKKSASSRAAGKSQKKK